MKNLVKAAALAVLFGTAAFCGAAETITQKPDLNKIEQKIKSDLQQSIQKNGPKHKETNDLRFSLAIFYAQIERFGEADKERFAAGTGTFSESARKRRRHNRK